METLKRYALRAITNIIIIDGKTVSLGQAKAREEICKGCDYFGTVEPIPGLQCDGCTKCGCPMATKTKVYSIPRKKDNHGEPLSVKEILHLKTLGKIVTSDLEQDIIICPHEHGNKWAPIDSNFFNL